MKKLLEFSIGVVFFISLSASAQQLTGIVVDENNTPIDNAEVYLKESAELFRTKEEGTFVFDGELKSPFTLIVFSFGYEVYQQEYNTVPQHLKIVLQKIQAENLNEVVVSQEREKGLPFKNLER